MNILIYDDDASFCTELADACAAINKKTHSDIANVVCSTNSAAEALEYVRANGGDAIVCLLDIMANNIPVGFDLARDIKEVNSENIIIYVTDYFERIAFDVEQKINALCFILKHGESFQKELAEVLLHTKKSMESQFYTVENTSGAYRVNYKDIYYFEKDKRSQNVVLVYRGGYSTFRSTLVKVKNTLPDHFCYAHKAFIVNAENIILADKKTMTLHFDDAQQCPFSLLYKKEILKWVTK